MNPSQTGTPMIDSLLLTAARISTFQQQQPLTNASGFYFARNDRLFLVTSGHVMADAPSNHHPDRIEIELHADAVNLTQSSVFSIPLFKDGQSVWRQGRDSAGTVDIAVIELEQQALPASMVYRAFTPEHLASMQGQIGIGSSVLVVGFPLGFHDTLHHMPVVRHAIIASAFGLRFQGDGYFLTDARTHRGTSGAPVVMRVDPALKVSADLPWVLLGVHSSRIDITTRDVEQDENLGLNCTWYSDMLMTLTE